MSLTPCAAKYSASRSVETVMGPSGVAIIRPRHVDALAGFTCGRNDNAEPAYARSHPLDVAVHPLLIEQQRRCLQLGQGLLAHR